MLSGSQWGPKLKLWCESSHEMRVRGRSLARRTSTAVVTLTYVPNKLHVQLFRRPILGPVARVDENRLAAWRALLWAHAATMRVLERELEAECGLPLAWYDVLAQLNAAGGRLRMSELADAVLLSRGGLTRLVDRIVAAGLVCREACASDRRSAFAVLTPAGRAALRRASRVHLAGIERHFAAHVSPDEAVTVARALQRVAEAAGTTVPRNSAKGAAHA